MRPVIPIGELTEKQLEQQAVGTKTNPGLARMLGFRCYHTLRSKGSEAGYPDWTLARERVLFIEFKKADGKVSPAQKEWVAALLNAGAEAYIIRPRHLDDLARILQHRGDPYQARGDLPNIAARLHQDTLTEIADRREKAA